MNVGAAANTVTWVVELPESAVVLERNGFNARSLKIGDAVTVQGAAQPAPHVRACEFGRPHERRRGPVQVVGVGSRRVRASAALARRAAAARASARSQGLLEADVQDPERRTKAGDAVAMPWAKAVLDYRVRTEFKDDPAARCVPPGGPRQFLGPQGFQFVEQRELGRILVLLGDGNRNWRIIYTDGRPQGQPADVVSSYYGSSVGHWEKDTLVVDSVGYNEKFWFMSGGLPHTEALHLTERFTRRT